MTVKSGNSTIYREVEDAFADSSPTRRVESESDNQLLPLSAYRREQQSLCTSERSHRVLPFTDPVINTTMPRSSGILTCEWDQFKSTYAVSAHFRLPELFGRRVLNIDFAIRLSAVYWTSISLRSGTISVSNWLTVIPQSGGPASKAMKLQSETS